MASLKRWMGRVALGVSCLAAVSVAAASVPASQPAEVSPAQLIGTWRGSSVCTDRIAAPACRDETVVYQFTPGSRPGTVHWAADKVVDGRRENMGALELAFDKADACWKAEFASPRVRSVWCLVVEGARMSGTARLLPGNEIVRKIDVRKEERRQ